MSNPYGNDPYGQQPPNPYGQGGGASFDAPGVGGFEQKKTDGVSVAALVLGLLCCSLGGLILGFIGLGRTKGGQRKGRGMAIAGIVLGIIGLIVNAAVIIGLVAGVGFLNSIVTPDNAEVGQCVNVDVEGSNEVFLREAECSEEHDAEIVGVAEVTEENLEQVDSLMVGYCAEIIDDADLAKLADYLDDMQAVTEDPSDVEVGDHLVCYIEPDDKLDEPIL